MLSEMKQREMWKIEICKMCCVTGMKRKAHSCGFGVDTGQQQRAICKDTLDFRLVMSHDNTKHVMRAHIRISDSGHSGFVLSVCIPLKYESFLSRFFAVFDTFIFVTNKREKVDESTLF